MHTARMAQLEHRDDALFGIASVIVMTALEAAMAELGALGSDSNTADMAAPGRRIEACWERQSAARKRVRREIGRARAMGQSTCASRDAAREAPAR